MNTQKEMWIDGKRHTWTDPSRETLHQCAYDVQKRLGGSDLCQIVDELLERQIHPRDIAWGLIETQLALKTDTTRSVSAFFMREVRNLARARAKRINN